MAALRFARRPAGPAPVDQGLGRGVALRGTVWPGGDAEPFDGVVVVAPDGTIAELAPAGALRLPADLPVLGGARCWIGPGVIDAHVHLAFGSRERGAARRARCRARPRRAPGGRAALADHWAPARPGHRPSRSPAR